MATLDFSEMARLISHSRTTEIDLTLFSGTPGRWSLHEARHKVHMSSYRFRVLYVNSNATHQDLQAAAKQLHDNSHIHVVFAPSIAKAIRQNREIYPLYRNAKGLWTTKEYLVSFIKDELKAYLDRLVDQSPQFYVDPRVNTPVGIPIRLPNPLRSFLSDPDSASHAFGGKVAILLAEPGQGKTYMCRHLVSSLAQGSSGALPLMVDSSQWHTLSVEDQTSLPKTIAHSFRHFGAPIGWLDGHEEEFLKVTLKADVFRIVFDGFDEYILRNRGLIQPLDVLHALAALASTTGTRIIITSRTSFWHTSLPEVETADFLERTGSLLYILQPFDLSQAKNYFSSRLNDQRKISTAVQTYSVLSQNDQTLVGRGFVLSLIADLADRNATTTEHRPLGSNPLLWLIDALCEREVVRQQLPYSSTEQVSVLRTLATETALGSPFNTELLQLALSEVRPNLDIQSLESTVEKLKSHPLLEKNKDQDLWRFKQEQVGVALIADQIVTWPKEKLIRFIGRMKIEASSRQDIGSTIVELVKERVSRQEAPRSIREICNAISPPEQQDATAGGEEGRRLAAAVTLLAVERFLPRGSAHRERAELLLYLRGGNAVRSLTFTGTIARYDFENVRFEKCRFERVSWANCRFNEETVFENCDFKGGAPPAHCDGFGSVELKDCRLDADAEAMFNSARVKEGKRKYSVEDLRTDLKSVIDKFIIRGGLGLKTVAADNLNKGTISASRYKDEILEAVIGLILEEHSISGGVSGYAVRLEAIEAVKFYAANNVFTGSLREAFDKLQTRLSLA